MRFKIRTPCYDNDKFIINGSVIGPPQAKFFSTPIMGRNDFYAKNSCQMSISVR